MTTAQASPNGAATAAPDWSRRDRMPDLADAVCLVTGAATGLGSAISEMLVREGARVTCADMRADRVATTVKRLQDAGGDVRSTTVDLCDAAAATELVEDTVSRYGRIDLLVNNAGTDVSVAVDELTVEEFDRVLHTNLRAPFLLARAALPHMKRQRSGHIVNVCSTAGLSVWPNAGAYCASKWGLRGLSRAMHLEAREHNVRVTAVLAGGMETPFIMERFPGTDTTRLQDPAQVAEVVRAAVLAPGNTVVPEIMAIPMGEPSWP